VANLEIGAEQRAKVVKAIRASMAESIRVGTITNPASVALLKEVFDRDNGVPSYECRTEFSVRQRDGQRE